LRAADVRVIKDALESKNIVTYPGKRAAIFPGFEQVR
jgi:hypothetical protein